MRILLDECIDRHLARSLTGHEVKTVPQMGWAAVKNGALLGLAEGQFDVFLTVDRNLSFQQNLPRFNTKRSRGFGRKDVDVVIVAFGSELLPPA